MDTPISSSRAPFLAEEADSRLPRYQRLRDDIVARIVAGEWTAGQALPAETEIARQHGLALGTVRKALDLLVAEGVLERIQGRGTFIRRIALDRSLFRFFRATGSDGARRVPRARILARALLPCPPAAAAALGLTTSQSGLRLDRLRLDGETPLFLEEIWLDPDRFAPLAELPLGEFGDLLYPLYERLCGEVIASASETLTIGSASAAQAGPLGLQPGAAVVLIERLARGHDSRPVEWRLSCGAADRFRYRIDIR